MIVQVYPCPPIKEKEMIMAKAKQDEKSEMSETIYLIEFEDGSKKKITVPSDWKVTFGPVVVGKNTNHTRGRHAGEIPLALRFYESETKQRAIFTHVASFRDLSINIQEERVQTKNKTGSMDIDGHRKNVSMRAVVKEWINPDKEDSDDTQLLVNDFGDDISLDD